MFKLSLFLNTRDGGEWKKGNETQRNKRKEVDSKVGGRAKGGR